MYVDVILHIQSNSPTLFVPKSALVNSKERIFVIKAYNKKAEWINVKKGIVIDGLSEVFGILKEGDIIVKMDSEEVRNGSELNIR